MNCEVPNLTELESKEAVEAETASRIMAVQWKSGVYSWLPESPERGSPVKAATRGNFAALGSLTRMARPGLRTLDILFSCV